MPPATTDEPLCLALEAMGTRFELVLPDVPRDGRARARLFAVGEAALDEVRRAEARWSLFRPDAFLAHLVRAAHGEAVRLDEDDFELLDAARRAFELSGGAFDPAVAPRLADAGFARPAAVAAGARDGTFADVVLDPHARTVRLARPGVALDLGGVAKGHALDRAVRVLCDAGVRSALLHGGTSAVAALGAPPAADARGWRVQLAGDGAPTLELRDAALAVSAAHGATSATGAAHVVDPRARVPGGAPRPPVAAGAVVLGLGDDPAPLALVDALATALLVLGAPVAPGALPCAVQYIQPWGAAWRRAAGPPPPTTSPSIPHAPEAPPTR